MSEECSETVTVRSRELTVTTRSGELRKMHKTQKHSLAIFFNPTHRRHTHTDALVPVLLC